jgi:energy-coupling factor transporter transmembrane protein EcfT
MHNIIRLEISGAIVAGIVFLLFLLLEIEGDAYTFILKSLVPGFVFILLLAGLEYKGYSRVCGGESDEQS